MKISLILSAMVIVCVNLFAQGTVNFANSPNSLVTSSFTGGPLPSGTSFKAALYYLHDQANQPNSADFDARRLTLDPASPIGTVTPGLFNGGVRNLPDDTTAGRAAWFQVRVWETQFGTTYEQALVAPPIAGRKALVGTSNILRVGRTGIASQTSPADLTSWGLQTFNLVPVPLGSRYNFNDCLVPSETSVNGAARVATDGTGNCVLHLTDAGQFQTNGGFVIPDAAGGSNVTHLHVRWKSRIGGATSGVTQFGRSGGDGYSFNWGTDLATTAGPEGTGTGLTVTVDTFDNGGGEAPGLEIKWRGNRVAFHNITSNQGLAKDFLRRNAFVDAHLDVDTAGRATFTYDGQALNATLANWAGIAGGRFVFGAATGAATDNHWIDDLVIDLADVRISDFSIDPVITFHTLRGHFYAVDKTASLSPVNWQPLVGSVPGTDGLVSVSDKGAGTLDQRHYRVRLVE